MGIPPIHPIVCCAIISIGSALESKVSQTYSTEIYRKIYYKMQTADTECKSLCWVREFLNLPMIVVSHRQKTPKKFIVQ